NSPPQVTVHSGGFWAAAATSGHHLGGTGPKRTVPSSSFHPDQSQPTERPVLAGKCKNPIEFNPKFKELDPPPPAAISGDQDRTIVSDPTVRSEPNLRTSVLYVIEPIGTSGSEFGGRGPCGPV
ncbi:HXXXD-type acyl-transferase family protein, partial [Prunus dulcis]